MEPEESKFSLIKRCSGSPMSGTKMPMDKSLYLNTTNSINISKVKQKYSFPKDSRFKPYRT